MKKERKLECPEKSSDDKFQKKPHVKAPKWNSLSRLSIMMQNEVCNAALGHQVILHIRLQLWTLNGAPPLDRQPAKAEGAQSAHQWLKMHWPLTLLSSPAEAVYRGVATVIHNSFLGARSESWVLGNDQCSRPSQGMLLSGLQRYLSPDIPYTPIKT